MKDRANGKLCVDMAEKSIVFILPGILDIAWGRDEGRIEALARCLLLVIWQQMTDVIQCGKVTK